VAVSADGDVDADPIDDARTSQLSRKSFTVLAPLFHGDCDYVALLWDPGSSLFSFSAANA